MLSDFKFHHIGYAVCSIEESARIYVSQGWSLADTVEDPIQNVRISFIERDDMPRIEFVEPVDENSPIYSTLDKVGVAPYHICYEVTDIEDAIKRLRKLRFMPLFKPVPAVALNNRLICYLFSNSAGLIEIVQ